MRLNYNDECNTVLRRSRELCCAAIVVVLLGALTFSLATRFCNSGPSIHVACVKRLSVEKKREHRRIYVVRSLEPATRFVFACETTHIALPERAEIFLELNLDTSLSNRPPPFHSSSC